MFKRRAKWMATAALVVGALTACDEGPGLTEVAVSDGLYDDAINASPYDTGFTLQTAALYVESTGATLASMESETFGDVAKALIGEDGGTLRAGDHTLVIPPDAVDDDTWFRMEVVSGANILVDLKALDAKDGDRVYEFERSLTLTLSYKDIFSSGDPSQLRNVYLYMDSPQYMIPLSSKVDEKNRTISSPIWHFSLYGMAIE